MITPHLERLIFQGKAAYMTHVIGGTQKAILNVKPNHFIVILDLHYNYAMKMDKIMGDADSLTQLETKFNTQVKIFSSKSHNSFMFRDAVTLAGIAGGGNPFYGMPNGGIKLDTYLIHESDVSFTISNAGTLSDSIAALLDPASIGFAPPYDYGKEGLVGSIPIREVGKVDLSTSGDDFVNSGGELYTAGQVGHNTPNELMFPVDLANNYVNINDAFNYPIINVGYVEIDGNLTDIKSTGA